MKNGANLMRYRSGGHPARRAGPRALVGRRRQVPIGWRPTMLRGQQLQVERHQPMPRAVHYQGGPSPQPRARRAGTISAAEYQAGRPSASPMAVGHWGRPQGTFDAGRGLAVGAPITVHDAEAMARVLRQHGYTVGAPTRARENRKRKRKRKGGRLVGFAKALTGSR